MIKSELIEKIAEMTAGAWRVNALTHYESAYNGTTLSDLVKELYVTAYMRGRMDEVKEPTVAVETVFSTEDVQ